MTDTPAPTRVEVVSSPAFERLATLEVEMKHVIRLLEKIDGRLDEIEKRVGKAEDAILESKVSTRTAWAIMGAFATAAGAIGALVAKLIPLIR